QTISVGRRARSFAGTRVNEPRRRLDHALVRVPRRPRPRASRARVRGAGAVSRGRRKGGGGDRRFPAPPLPGFAARRGSHRGAQGQTHGGQMPDNCPEPAVHVALARRWSDSNGADEGSLMSTIDKQQIATVVKLRAFGYTFSLADGWTSPAILPDPSTALSTAEHDAMHAVQMHR